ncbi:MAG: hypothetical protein IH571_07065 [Acholeplasmataceae bacterium]|nr:hypothetical protein [Acholeplasmataceae bacterium]
MKTMTVDQLKDTLEKAMKFNDYDWNRKMRIKYKTKKRAEGLEYYIYFCPKCQKIQTISTHGNDVYCSHCGTIATFDMYGFIEGLPFDNLVEWGKLQKEVLPSIAHNVYLSEGMMYEINFKKNKRIPLGFMRIKLENNVLTFEKNQNKFVFNIDDVQGLAISQKRFLSFDYIKQTYLVAFKDPMLFLDVIHTLKGDQ